MSARAGPLAGACPAPAPEVECVTLAHGSGAGASAALFEQRILGPLENPALGARHDGAVLSIGAERIALTTDSFVVSPLWFPGGDIGSLAVHGTLNDLAMCGARPSALSCALVLEEGLELAVLDRVLASLAAAARAAGVPVVTGDTKVVERGKGDGLFVNTTGVGRVPPGRDLRPQRVEPGQAVLLSGSLGCHGAAVLAAREDLGLEGPIRSDSAAVGALVEALLEAAPGTRCLRDPTRGGLGAALWEIAEVAGVEIEVEEPQLPVEAPVRALSDLLGLDPLFLACEGRFAAFVPGSQVDAALAALRAHPLGADAVCAGRVCEGSGRVVLRTAFGARRSVLRPHGELQPRIC